jgi:ABC-type Na+ efflux pump permease subunit
VTATASVAAAIPLMLGAAAIGRAHWGAVLIWAPLSMATSLFARAALQLG